MPAMRAPAPTRWPDNAGSGRASEHRDIETGASPTGSRCDAANLSTCSTRTRVPDAPGWRSASTARPGFILNDAMWAEYALGARFGVQSAQGAPATANPFRAGAPYSVEALGKRGVVFLACNRALTRLSRDLAGASGNATAVHAELVANVLPQCLVTPAMVVALSRAQGRGVPYMAVA
jgi:hypothetical protein